MTTNLAALRSALLAADARTLATAQAILDLLSGVSPPPAPVRAMLALPPVHRKGILLANYQLKNDWIVGPVAVVATDDEGTPVPLPTGAAFTVAVDDTTLLNAEMSTDGLSVTFNALKRRGTATMTFHETHGLLPDFPQGVDIVEDFTPAAGALDLSNPPHSPQPVPPA